MAHQELLLDNQLCFRLYSASRLITQAYTPMLSKMGLTYPQYLVMLVLWEKDHQPVNDIAQRLMLETNTVTPLLQRMEKAGKLTRTRGKSDKRHQIVSLTELGKSMEQTAFDNIPTGMSERFATCPLKTEDYTYLAEELDRIINNLKSSSKN